MVNGYEKIDVEQLELDITQKELEEQFGMDPDQAAKLLKALPGIFREGLEKYPYPKPKPDGEGEDSINHILDGFPYSYQSTDSGKTTEVSVDLMTLLDKTLQMNSSEVKTASEMSDDELDLCIKYIDKFFQKATGDVQMQVLKLPSGNVGSFIARMLDALTTPLATMVTGGNVAPDVEPLKDATGDKQKFLKRFQDRATAIDFTDTDDLKVFAFTDNIVLDVDHTKGVMEDGVYRAPAVATSNMVQDYGDIKVLKDADELKLAADYARQLYITDDHPVDKLVTSQDEIKGWTSDVEFDEKNKSIKCDVLIGDEETIKKVKDGKTDVSIGFLCDLDETPGELDGIKYDAVQRNIILNHLAIVDNGRCPSGTCGIGIDTPTANDCDDCDTGTCEDKDKVPPETKGGDLKDITIKAGDKYELPNGAGSITGPAVIKDGEITIGGGGVLEITSKDQDPKTEEERAMTHFKLSKEDWDKLSKEEQEALIKKLPERGTGKDGDVSAHEKLLNEKIGAIKAIAKELSDKGTTMAPADVRARVSQMSSISYELGEMVNVIQTKAIPVDTAILDMATSTRTEAEKIVLDNMDAGAYLLEEVNSHTHTVDIDTDGNGKTTENDSHTHDIKEWLVQPESDHIHILKAVEASDSDAMKPGKYMLEEEQDHTHTVTLNESGDGKSTTVNDHFHNVKSWEVMTANGHKHGLKPEGSDGEPDGTLEDTDVSGHQKLLTEKINAIKAIAKELADKGSTMNPADMSARISQMSDIMWRLRDDLAVIGAKNIDIGDGLKEDCIKTIDSLQSVKDKAQPFIDEHTRLVDNIMDHNTPFERKVYEGKTTDELKELTKLIDFSESSTSHSLPPVNSVEDAFDRAVQKRRNGGRPPVSKS